VTVQESIVYGHAVGPRTHPAHLAPRAAERPQPRAALVLAGQLMIVPDNSICLGTYHRRSSRASFPVRILRITQLVTKVTPVTDLHLALLGSSWHTLVVRQENSRHHPKETSLMRPPVPEGRTRINVPHHCRIPSRCYRR
jgi:hypothetical protein